MNVAPIADDARAMTARYAMPIASERRAPGPPLDERDERIEREREEDRDQDPGDHVPRDPDDLEQHRDRDDREQDAQQGPRAHLDDPVAHRPKDREPVGRRCPRARTGRLLGRRSVESRQSLRLCTRRRRVVA